jgi:hypothetical protein
VSEQQISFQYLVSVPLAVPQGPCEASFLWRHFPLCSADQSSNRLRPQANKVGFFDSLLEEE